MVKSRVKKIVLGSLAVLAVSAFLAASNNGNLANAADGESGPGYYGNVFLDSILPDKNYYHPHNSTSPDGTKMFVSINKADKPYGKTSGVIDLYLLDAVKMSQGEVVKLFGPVSIGSAETTPKNKVFRSTWTADGKRIMVSGGDRFWVIDAADLKPLNGVEGNPDLLPGTKGKWHHNHDALPTTDGKYVLLTLRTKPHSGDDADMMDGEIKLYDLAANKVVGAGLSVCNGCHTEQFDEIPNGAVLCGLDGKLEKQADNTYAGTVYVAGHGGHVAKADLTIDPADKAKPISMTLSRLTVSEKKFADTGAKSDDTSQYKLHDVRLDGNGGLYWSTFNTDAANKVHYGKLDLATGEVVKDVAIDVDARATMPDLKAKGDRGSIYCGSALSKTAYMPMTMTNEAYLTVIPRF
jgi:hypothetical protein